MCVNEFQSDRNCTQGPQCKFSHDISEDQRKNPEIREIINKKLEKISRNNTNGNNRLHDVTDKLCIFEFQKQDNCEWGKKCRFSHTISEGQRNDPELKEEILIKTNNFHGRRDQRASQPNSDEILVPRSMLKQLYSLLNTSTDNSEYSSRFS